MSTYHIKIDMDRKCTRCRKKGALENGLCLSCLNEAIIRGEFNHIFKNRNAGVFGNMETAAASNPPATEDAPTVVRKP